MVTVSDNLAKARMIRTQRIKDAMKSSIRELIAHETPPTRYKVHIDTNIAYSTLNKYFDEVLHECY